MTLDLTGPVRKQPSRARSAKGKQVAARGLGARSRPPARSSYEKDGRKMTCVVLLSRRRVYCSSARGKQVAALRHGLCSARSRSISFGKFGTKGASCVVKMTRRIPVIEGLTMHAHRVAWVGRLGTRTKLPSFEKNGGARFQ